MSRRKWSWTPLQADRLYEVQQILKELKDYLPVTVRQIHYQRVGKGWIENTTGQYKALMKVVKYARIDGYIPWEAIEDRVRQAYLNRGWQDQDHFLKTERKNFLEGYRRDLQQGQENYIEVWLEKDALAGIFQRILNPYCIPLCPARGDSSVTYLRKFQNRVLLRQRNGQRTIMAYFGDHDPSGDEMLDSMKITLEREMKLESVEYDRIALTPEQVEKYDLPVQMSAAKKTDPRYRKFVEKHGPRATELDALAPKMLQELIQGAIAEYINLPKVYYHRREQKKEELTLRGFKQKIEAFIDDNWEEK